MRDLRCPSRLHALFDEATGEVEVKCSSRRCGARPGTVVLHRFDASTGTPTRTLTFRTPERQTPTTPPTGD